MAPEEKNKEPQQPTTERADNEALRSNSSMTTEQIAAAHIEAEKDMEEDAELTASSPNDDLDEGELAQLGEDETPIQ